MFHRKRFRLAIVVVLTLLLTAVQAPTAGATFPPPNIDPGAGEGAAGDDDQETVITLPPNLSGGDDGNGDQNGDVPPDPNDPDGKNGNGSAGNGSAGNGSAGNGNGGASAPPPDSWPPPNAVVHHAATPVQISALSSGLNLYFIGPDGTVTSGPIIASLTALAEMHPDGDAVSLYHGTNPGSGKPVTIEYLPADMKIRVSTFYADSPPHDFDKAYIFTVDADHSVTHEQW